MIRLTGLHSETAIPISKTGKPSCLVGKWVKLDLPVVKLSVTYYFLAISQLNRTASIISNSAANILQAVNDKITKMCVCKEVPQVAEFWQPDLSTLS